MITIRCDRRVSVRSTKDRIVPDTGQNGKLGPEKAVHPMDGRKPGPDPDPDWTSGFLPF